MYPVERGCCRAGGAAVGCVAHLGWRDPTPILIGQGGNAGRQAAKSLPPAATENRDKTLRGRVQL
jgi:hypothetical protein